ncbi:MAG: glycoside hydrolase family 32 protein [Bacteroidetes bacterium]|nr:glycoside hydrolase family 32 protein [Bacteroidota bacterium]
MKRLFFIVINTVVVSSMMAQESVDLKIESDYLHFPVSYDDDAETRVELVIGKNVIRAFDIFLPDQDPNFWVFLDVSDLKGKKVTIRTRYGEDKKGLGLVYQSDDREYLEGVYKEKRRPQLHFSSMRGWNNDPNGLIYYDGEYHLFYQHNPYGYDWGNMHWGHSVSTDLMHWKELPEALYPDEIGVAYSGSAVIDYNNTSGFKSGEEEVIVAIYTSTWFPDRDQKEARENPLERQSLAYSNDRGRTWTKYDGNPVIGDRRKILGSGNDRDPNVFWHEPTQKWVMILFERIGMSIFTSDDLKEWKEESHFETFWECPELFELPIDGDPNNTKWVVYDAGGDYVLGDFDGKEFKITSGAHNYIDGEFFAAQTYENIPATDGRRIQIGWGTIQTPGMPFNMMMAFPTELTLRTTNNGVRMFNEPANEIDLLHSKEYKRENISPEEANIVLKEIKSDKLHLKCEIENINAIAYTFNFDGDDLKYSIRNNTFILNDEERIFKYLPELGSKKMKFEIILDKSSIEVYVDYGRFTMVLPRNLDSENQGLSIVPGYGDLTINIKSLEVYEMKSIWE